MPVTRNDLLAAANEMAAKLGNKAISDRVLRDWIDEGLVTCARAQGNRLWLYPDDARLVVENIMKFRSQGAHRVSQLATCLWVFCLLSDFEFVKRSLQSEFPRTRKQHERKFPWNYDYRNERNISDNEREKYNRHLAPIDPDLAAAGFNLPTDVLLPVMSWVIWGEDSRDSTRRLISTELAEFLQMPSAAFDELFHFINIGGALGAPDEIENSGEAILDKITINDLETARTLIWICLFSLMAGELFFSVFGIIPENKIATAYRKSAESFLRPDWVVASLGLFAIAAFHLRTSNNPDK